LDDAALLDRGGEIVEFAFVEVSAGIARVRPQEFDWRFALTARPVDRRGFVADVSQQSGQSSAEARTGFGVASGVFGHF
jgi:hypothetical protein